MLFFPSIKEWILSLNYQLYKYEEYYLNYIKIILLINLLINSTNNFINKNVN